MAEVGTTSCGCPWSGLHLHVPRPGRPGDTAFSGIRLGPGDGVHYVAEHHEAGGIFRPVQASTESPRRLPAGSWANTGPPPAACQG
jgi:hypothetical protein